MSETVDVTVKLPKPPEGFQWEIEQAPISAIEGDVAALHRIGYTVTINHHLCPIKPPTIAVTLTREVAARFGNSLYNTLDMVALNDACRAALAGNADVDKSGVLMCRQWINAVPVPCALAKGHKGECRG